MLKERRAEGERLSPVEQAMSRTVKPKGTTNNPAKTLAASQKAARTAAVGAARGRSEDRDTSAAREPDPKAKAKAGDPKAKAKAPSAADPTPGPKAKGKLGRPSTIEANQSRASQDPTQQAITLTPAAGSSTDARRTYDVGPRQS